MLYGGIVGYNNYQTFIRCTAPDLKAVRSATQQYTTPIIITNISKHTVELQFNQSGTWTALSPGSTKQFSYTNTPTGAYTCQSGHNPYNISPCNLALEYTAPTLQMYVPGIWNLDGERPPFNIGIYNDYPIANIPAPTGTCSQGIPAGMAVGIVSTPDRQGYWVAAQDGQISACGDAPNLGDITPPMTVAAIAAAPSGKGYWLVTANGLVYAFGSAVYHGQPVLTAGNGHFGRMISKAPSSIVDITADPVTGGYWLLDATGNVYSYDAPYFGAANGKATVSIAATSNGKGYWVITKSGQVLSFGNAHNWGSPKITSSTAVNITADQATSGYWVTTSSGTVTAFHAAPLGSASGWHSPAVGLTALAGGNGYLVVAANGQVANFGTAHNKGSAS
jgi:hypothetical protein